MLPGLTGFRDGQSSLRETRSQQGPCDCPGSVQPGVGGRQLRILTAVAVFRRMNRQIEPSVVRRFAWGFHAYASSRPTSLPVCSAQCAVGLTGAQSAQALTVEHVEAIFPIEETIEDACAFPVAVSGTTSVRVTAFRDEEGNFVKVILHSSSSVTFSANGKTISAKERINEFDVDFDPSGGAPSTIGRTGVFPISHLPGGGTIVQAGRIVEDLTTGSIVFERGNLETEGDVSAFCEALS
jgi:hypothetical protein